MSGIFLPFDQATLYNIVAELLAGQTIDWIKQGRRSKKSYIHQVAQETVANARARGITVELKPLTQLLSSDDFWDEVAINKAHALRLRLKPLVVAEDSPSQDEAAVLLAADLMLAAVRRLPFEQRIQVNQLSSLQTTLDSMHQRIQGMQAEISAGFSVVADLLREGKRPRQALKDQDTRLQPSAWSKPAATLSLTQLLHLQYPWGEWSDRRTELESIIAERRPKAWASVPKPNVARTLFALEALESFSGAPIDRARSQAVEWMKSSITTGWFREWSEGQTSHSETQLAEIVRRADIRHTAQVLTACSRWQESRDPLARLIHNISTSILPDSGFWPNNPHGTTPRLLASVYAVEALQTVASNGFRLPLSDLVDKAEENSARRALRRGVGALLSDCEQGNGLVGGITSVPNAYLTGLALFRLGYLAQKGSDLAELTELMAEGLLGCAREYGWDDASVPPSMRARTRLRTTLRCAAGLSRANQAGVKVASALLEHAVRLCEILICSEKQELLDSPDYACGLISILLACKGMSPSDIYGSIEEEDPGERSERFMTWRTELELLISNFKPLADLSIPGYREVVDEYEARLYSLI
jgi:hypothetical protein